jgi:hypothetical protein
MGELRTVFIIAYQNDRRQTLGLLLDQFHQRLGPATGDGGLGNHQF